MSDVTKTALPPIGFRYGVMRREEHRMKARRLIEGSAFAPHITRMMMWFRLEIRTKTAQASALRKIATTSSRPS
jgi:hypothetical protein